MKETNMIRVNGGAIYAHASEDPDYPGIELTFVSDEPLAPGVKSRPQVRMEMDMADKKLRVLIWNDKSSEDASGEFELDN